MMESGVQSEPMATGTEVRMAAARPGQIGSRDRLTRTLMLTLD